MRPRALAHISVVLDIRTGILRLSSGDDQSFDELAAGAIAAARNENPSALRGERGGAADAR